MATEKQIEANRQNAQRSTGPRTPEGKSISRRNALKTGIHAEIEVFLPTENPDHLKTLTNEFYDAYAPATPMQRTLLDSIIRGEWILRRLAFIEATMIKRQSKHARIFNEDEEFLTGIGYLRSIEDISRIERRRTNIDRSNAKNMQLFLKLQKEEVLDPQPPAPEPELELPDPVDPPPPPQIGFVLPIVPEGLIPVPEMHSNLRHPRHNVLTCLSDSHETRNL